MCEPFDVPFTGPAADLLAKAKTQIEAQDGTVTGDTTSGNISITMPIVGSIEGNYKIAGQVITIQLTKTPTFVPCDMIASKIKEALA